MKSPNTALVCLSIVWAGHLIGCSTADTSGSGGTGGFEGSNAEAGPSSTSASNGATSGSTSTTSGSTSTGGTTSSTGGGDECSAKATYDECDECECAKNQAGCDAYGKLEKDSCYCGATAPCAMACAATVCADLDSDAACDMCIETADESCWDAASMACATDADCTAYAMASETSCANLPD